MIRENTFTPVNNWTKPFVSEVAEVLALLREYGYESAKLVKLTGISERRFCDWTAGYKKEPYEVSYIPYTCWCFLVALVGRPNINNRGDALSVDVRKVLSAFDRNAFLPASKFVSPSRLQLNRVVGEGVFTGLTFTDLAESFNWRLDHFEDNLEKNNIPFLNWCLILMYLGLDIQKMILTDLDEELIIGQS
ncbi:MULTISPECIES: hypothetical protein [Photobacterium]|uniref:Uncharacterized protein n=2 Tax=Photobacterium TaxID=657 RepID=Q6LIM1_PHOPR|nr:MULTISPECIES: hypothetical protein [Photobacterium]PSU47376.1 hypothetical protein C9J12_15375 [Photobacterium frigidiphilum]CAG22859.1 hypothetical protein PBPRB0987 [Photobacterium profundum SS9]